MSKEIIVKKSERFGRLKVIREVEKISTPSGQSLRAFLCRCECGTEKEYRLASLTSGNTKSCGCWNREAARERRTTHGKCGTRAYNSWSAMHMRCNQQRWAKHYKDRGIAVCPRWNKFENFYADMGDPPVGKSLDRVNNDKGYSPKNCRWATRAEQVLNTRRAIKVRYKGKQRFLFDLIAESGLHRMTVIWRIRRSGWTPHKALTTPVPQRSAT